jgi:hypothetical protein
MRDNPYARMDGMELPTRRAHRSLAECLEDDIERHLIACRGR